MGYRGVVPYMFGVKLSVALCSTFQLRRSRLLAPRQGGGVRCAAMVGCRARPFARCAASLRMTQWVGWNVVRNFFGTKYSTVKLTDTAFCFSPHAPAPPRVILSEAAQPTNNHARPPNIAAQSNPAPSGAPAGGISIAERRHITPRTTLRPRPRWAGCVTWSRWNNGDPACWRPARGAGFDCAALFGCRVCPYTRCAASLRMTRGLQGRGTKYVRRKI